MNAPAPLLPPHALDDGADHPAPVARAERAARAGHRAGLVWLAGDDAAAHAVSLERALFDRGFSVTRLEPGLEDTRVLAARALVDAGLLTLVAGGDDPPPRMWAQRTVVKLSAAELATTAPAALARKLAALFTRAPAEVSS